MPKPPSTWTTISVGMSKAEKAALDKAAHEAGMARNTFIRYLIDAWHRRKGG